MEAWREEGCWACEALGSVIYPINVQVKLKETVFGEIRDYFSLEFGSRALPRSCVLFPLASNVYCSDSSQLVFCCFFLFCFNFRPWITAAAAATDSSCRCYPVTASRAAPPNAWGLLLFKLEEEGRKWKNSSKTDKRVDVWSLCRPMCWFVCLFACFIFVLFGFFLKEKTCVPSWRVRPWLCSFPSSLQLPCAAPFFWDFKAETSWLLAVFVCFLCHFRKSEADFL